MEDRRVKFRSIAGASWALVVVLATSATAQTTQAQQQGACDEKCVTRLDDEGYPMGAGCARVQSSDGTTGKNCYVDSTMPLGQCEIDFDCGSSLAATLTTSEGFWFHIGTGCQQNAAAVFAQAMSDLVGTKAQLPMHRREDSYVQPFGRPTRELRQL